VTVVGGGVAGLETARVAALRGHHVTVHERSGRLGGLTASTGPNGALAEWLIGAVTAAGVDVRLDSDVEAEKAPTERDRPNGDHLVVQCTGGRPGVAEYTVVGDDVRERGLLIDVATLREGRAELPGGGDVVVFDPIGGPIAVALAEELGARAVLVTQDHIAGNELPRTGDLAPANTRLARAGVRIMRRSLVRRVALCADGRSLEVEVADRFAPGRTMVACAAFVDCGFRLPTDPLPGVSAWAGDCVAPRTVHEAILEGRRVAHAI